MRDINTRDRETEEQNKILECSVCGMKFAPIAHWRYSVEEDKNVGLFAGLVTQNAHRSMMHSIAHAAGARLLRTAV